MITRDQADTCAHGTYMELNVLFASVAGVVERVNKSEEVGGGRADEGDLTNAEVRKTHRSKPGPHPNPLIILAFIVSLASTKTATHRTEFSSMVKRNTYQVRWLEDKKPNITQCISIQVIKLLDWNPF